MVSNIYITQLSNEPNLDQIKTGINSLLTTPPLPIISSRSSTCPYCRNTCDSLLRHNMIKCLWSQL